MDKIEKIGTESKINCVSVSPVVFQVTINLKNFLVFHEGCFIFKSTSWYCRWHWKLEFNLQCLHLKFSQLSKTKRQGSEFFSVVCYLGREFAFDMCVLCNAPLGCDCPVNATINNNVNKLPAQFLSNSAPNLSFNLFTCQRQYINNNTLVK